MFSQPLVVICWGVIDPVATNLYRLKKPFRLDFVEQQILREDANGFGMTNKGTSPHTVEARAT